MLEIALADVRSFTGFYDMVLSGDFLAAENVNSGDVKAMTFVAGGTEYRLLFSPDVYLTELLSERRWMLLWRWATRLSPLWTVC